jgi:iron(III) transport system substrate-binding protein
MTETRGKHMRGWGWVAGAATVSLLLAGCGGGGAADMGSAPGSGGGAQSAAEQVYANLNGMGSGARDAAIAAAKKEGELSLYTSMTSDVADAITKAFTDQYGIKINVFRGNSETVLQRTLQEGQAGRPGADVIETNFKEMETLVSEGQLGEFKGPALAGVEDTAKFDHWTADRLNIFLPAWNTNLIKPGEEPKSWEDLADPKYKGKFQLEISDSDWFENLTHYWLTQGKSQADVDKLWHGIAANVKTAKGHTTMMELLGAGQTPMDGMNYSYITERAKQDGAPVAYRGADGTTSVPGFPRPNGVGTVKDAAHPNAAWLFNDWILSDGQKNLVDMHLTPVRKVPGDTSLDGITLAPFDVAELSKNAAAWDQKYDELLRGVAAAPSS